MKPAPENITAPLAKNEVFVFGSNLAGVHGAGAAYTALKLFGAVRGQGIGLMGQSYGIATKDEQIKQLPLARIQYQVRRFLAYAALRPDLTFLVTPIGCGLAGYKVEDVASLFFEYDIPGNVLLPKSFITWKSLSSASCSPAASSS